jgi:flagellar basal body-associated protein FliL
VIAVTVLCILNMIVIVILVVILFVVTVAVAAVRVVVEKGQSDDVGSKSEATNDKHESRVLHLLGFHQSLDGFQEN